MKENQNVYRLELKDVGLLSEAIVKISGLSVIAGKNDNGKSSIAKVMMAIVKSYNISVRGKKSKNIEESNKELFNTMIRLLFDDQITSIGKDFSEIRLINLDKKTEEFYIRVRKNFCINYVANANQDFFYDCTFIQTPLVWDLVDFFSSIKAMQIDRSFYENKNEKRFDDIKYPYVFWDLYKKLVSSKSHRDANTDLIDEIINIINGEFIYERGIFYFQRAVQSKIVKMSSTVLATGIKQFGLIQMLLKNTYLTKMGFFIFDEPENHLHPEWQLYLAKFIVELVSRGISIMVNTHSPYMIESLYKYAEKRGVRYDFHIAQDNRIFQIDNSNQKTIKQIFGLLHRVDEQMDDEFDDMKEK